MNELHLDNSNTERQAIAPYLTSLLDRPSAERKNLEFVRSAQHPSQDRALFGHRFNPHVPALQRLVYVCKSGKLSGKLVRREGQPARGDDEVNTVFDYLAIIWDFIQTRLNRCSLDDNGMPLKITLRYHNLPCNCHWKPDLKQVVMGVIGPGNAEIDSFIADTDIIAHEFGHGIVDHVATLEGTFQSGAIDESFADIFAIALKQHLLRQRADQVGANWLFGETLFTHPGCALRSFTKAPAYVNHPALATDPQPKVFLPAFTAEKNQLTVTTKIDYAHLFSGIPSHAYYHVASKIGNDALLVWYDALHHLERKASFDDLKAATINSAAQRFGNAHANVATVTNAWVTVGL